MPYLVPTTVDFRNRFDRDFPFTANPIVDDTAKDKVRDKDLNVALTHAASGINESLFETQALFTEAYLLLTAHYLVMLFAASSQGLGSQFEWVANSKSVGNISAAYAIPDRISQSPNLAMYSKTVYGALYLQIVWPRMLGAIFTVDGATSPL
jgi:hypothetical protein